MSFLNTINSIQETLFDLCKDEKTELLCPEKFFEELESRGLRKNDKRLSTISTEISNNNSIDKEVFSEIFNLKDNEIISKVFQDQTVIPDFQSFTKSIEEIYWHCKCNNDEKVASYIPQFARVNPDYWGVSVCTIDGQRFSIGDVNIPFTVQSCCKPLTYAVALETLTQEVVHQYCSLLQTLVHPEMTLAEKFDFTQNWLHLHWRTVVYAL